MRGLMKTQAFGNRVGVGAASEETDALGLHRQPALPGAWPPNQDHIAARREEPRDAVVHSKQGQVAAGATVEGEWDWDSALDGRAVTEVEGGDPGVLVEDELVVKGVPSPKLVVDDAEHAGLVVERLESLVRDPTGDGDDERMRYVRLVGDGLPDDCAEFSRPNPVRALRLVPPLAFARLATPPARNALPASDVAAAIRTEPPDRLWSTAPIHPACASQLADQVLELSVAQLEEVVWLSCPGSSPGHDFSVETGCALNSTRSREPRQIGARSTRYVQSTRSAL